MVKITIPSYYQIESKNGHSYTVYCIEVYQNGECFRINRRYRDFYAFHRNIRKRYTTPEFPPKKVRNLSTKVIEDRRKGLEKYLQGLIKNDLIPQEMLEFLSLSHLLTSGKILDCKEPRHQSLITFKSDLRGSGISSGIYGRPSPCNSGSSSSSSLPDIVVKGTLDGFYSTEDDFVYKM